MKIRAVTFLLLILAGAAWASVELWQARGGLLRRNGIYLALQRDPDAALRRLDQALKLNPDDTQARLWKARILMSTGDTTASKSLLTAKSFPPSTQSAHDATTLMHAADYLNNVRPDPPERTLRSAKRIGGPEVAMSKAREGREQLSQGDLAAAAETLHEAVNLGDTNSETRLLAALTLASQGDFPQAQGVFESLPPSARAAARQRLATLGQQISVTLSASDALAAARRRSALTDVALWVQLQLAADSPDPAAFIAADSELASRLQTAKLASDSSTTSSTILSDDLPPGATMLTAQLLDLAGEPRLAFLTLQSLARIAPSLSLALRTEQLRGAKPTEVWLRETLASASNGTPSHTLISASELQPRGATKRDDFWAMYSESTLTTTITAARSGDHRIAIIARGDRAAGVSPRLAVSVNGDQPQIIAVPYDFWDVYPLMLSLHPGSNTVAISFVNNSVPPPASNEDRNAYVLGLIVESSLAPSAPTEQP